MSATLEVIKAGPVQFFEIDFSPGFGIYELQGTKGSGKTTVLKSADLLAGRKVDITVTDGELSGEVRGFGVTAPIGGKRRRKGDLDVSVIESEKYSLVDLVDPPYKDEKSRDQWRIKAILGLRGVIAEPADFFELVGGKEALEALVPPDKLATDDPVVLASRIKDALESKARQQESLQEHESGHAKACRENPDQIDIGKPHDSAELQAAYDQCKERQLKIGEQLKSAAEDERRRSEARESLQKAEHGYSGPSVEDAKQASQVASEAVSKSSALIADLEKRLSEAQAEHKTLEARREGAENALKSAESHQSTCDAWRKTLDSDPVAMPEPEEVAKASSDLLAAKESLEYGVKVRRVLEDEQRAIKHESAAKAAEEEAVRYRELAARTTDVLTQLVECPGMFVESVEGHPRFVVNHPKRGKTLFDELSDGERVRYSIDATLVQLDGPALASIPQRIFQDLPPADKLEVHEFCRNRKIYAIAAQVTDGDLRVRYLG